MSTSTSNSTGDQVSECSKCEANGAKLRTAVTDLNLLVDSYEYLSKISQVPTETLTKGIRKIVNELLTGSTNDSYQIHSRNENQNFRGNDIGHIDSVVSLASNLERENTEHSEGVLHSISGVEPIKEEDQEEEMVVDNNNNNHLDTTTSSAVCQPSTSSSSSTLISSSATAVDVVDPVAKTFSAAENLTNVQEASTAQQQSTTAQANEPNCVKLSSSVTREIKIELDEQNEQEGVESNEPTFVEEEEPESNDRFNEQEQHNMPIVPPPPAAEILPVPSKSKKRLPKREPSSRHKKQKQNIEEMNDMPGLLKLIKDGISAGVYDKILERAFDRMAKVTCESEESGDDFLSGDGLFLARTCVELYSKENELALNIMILLENLTDTFSTELMDLETVSMLIKVMTSKPYKPYKLKTQFRAAGVLSALFALGPEAWNINISREDTLKDFRMLITSKWNMTTVLIARGFEYNSLTGFLKLCKCEHTLECVLFGAWCLANLTYAAPKEYVLLLQKETELCKLLEILKNSADEHIAEFATMTIANANEFVKRIDT